MALIDKVFIFTLFEIIIGGGGRVFDLGPVTIRMINFLICVAIAVYLQVGSNLDRKANLTALGIMIAFVASIAPGASIDFYNGYSFLQVSEYIIPMFFWFLAPTAAFFIRDIRSVRRVSMIIMTGSFFTAIVCVTIFAFLFFGLLSPVIFYSFTANSNELFFRSDIQFFYKGIFFVAVGAIFAVTLKPKFWTYLTAVAVLAVVLSLTRGFIIFLPICLVAAVLAIRPASSSYLFVLFLVAVSSFFLNDFLDLVWYDASRSESLLVRELDFQLVLETTNVSSFAFGHGSAAFIGSRVSIENSYLDIFYHFGIVGLLFYLLPLALAGIYFLRARQFVAIKDLSSAYFFSMIFLYLVTATNPFITNSIGITCCIICLFSLRQLSVEASTLRCEK